MKWEVSTIGEHCSVTSSKRFHLSDRSQDGVPFYCSKEIIQKVKGEEVTDCDYIKEDFYESVKERFGVPQSGDLLITTRGTYGIPYIYKDSDRFYFADGNLTWLKDFDEKLKAEYLYYWVLSHEGQKKIDAIAKGTAQKAVPIASIKLLQIPLPPADVQLKITRILGAFDDLIENNLEQIKLLEEAAQRLYKEWFIDLRFPGHETTPIHDGIPKGWMLGTLGKVAEFKRGKTITKSQANEGTIPVVAGGLEPAYFHNIANTKAPVVTVSGSGANAGYTRMYHVDVFASDCSFADHNSTPYLEFAFCTLNEEKHTLKNMQKGSAQPHVYAKDINAIPIIIPDKLIMKRFCEIASQLFRKSGVLETQNMCLSQARDRLLPKLMSGEIEV